MWKGGGGARQRGVVCGGSRGYEVDSVNSATRTKRWADMTTCGARLPPTCMRKCLPEKRHTQRIRTRAPRIWMVMLVQMTVNRTNRPKAGTCLMHVRIVDGHPT